MKKKVLIVCLIIIAITVPFNIVMKSKHTFTLAATEGTAIKSEQIQPLFKSIRIKGDCDTEVVFTDIETKQTYKVGYITSGSLVNVKLENGKWYTVECAGNLTVSPVNVRVE